MTPPCLAIAGGRRTQHSIDCREDCRAGGLWTHARCARIGRPDTPTRGRLPMPLYLGRFRYSTDAVKALVSSPQDRSAAAREAAESLGGKLLGFWFTFGEYVGAFLAEMPDNASSAALAMAGGAGGAVHIETTVIMDMDEAQDAM